MTLWLVSKAQWQAQLSLGGEQREGEEKGGGKECDGYWSGGENNGQARKSE